MARTVENVGWRGGHVLVRFLPMMLLGVIFLVLGLSPAAPHFGALTFGFIFVWIGVILIVGAVLGMLFTRCPLDYQTHWVVCLREPDVLPAEVGPGYYRDLSPPPEEP